VLAIEADRTVFLEQQEVVDFANRNRMVIVALEDGRIEANIPEDPCRARER
jgi:hypothetical protein